MFIVKQNYMAKYSEKANKTVESAMRRRKKGTLKSGGSGKTVKSRKQAIAIGLSEAREKGAKVPPAKKASKKGAKKKGASKKGATKKKAGRKKAASKKSSTRRPAAKKGRKKSSR
jgi:hypothetical protein